MTGHSSSLIVVSNRLPFVLSRRDDDTLYRKPSAGGLVTAVAPVMVQSGGKPEYICEILQYLNYKNCIQPCSLTSFYWHTGLWIGWPGSFLKDTDKIPESDPGDSSPTAGLKSNQIMPINLTTDDYELYLKGCCNGTFWPLFHSMPDRTVFDEKYWTSYR